MRLSEVVRKSEEARRGSLLAVLSSPTRYHDALRHGSRHLRPQAGPPDLISSFPLDGIVVGMAHFRREERSASRCRPPCLLPCRSCPAGRTDARTAVVVPRCAASWRGPVAQQARLLRGSPRSRLPEKISRKGLPEKMRQWRLSGAPRFGETHSGEAPSGDAGSSGRTES